MDGNARSRERLTGPTIAQRGAAARTRTGDGVRREAVRQCGKRRGRGTALSKLLRIVMLAGAALCAEPAHAQTRVPLPDLGAGTYLGAQGGLYPGGANAPPAAHAAAALAEAAAIVPRDASGAPAADGLIGFVCLGMSNSSQEFEDLERALDADPARNAQVVAVNTCAGGQSAELMDDAADLYWTTIAPQRLAAAGVDPDQVQVGWLKQAYGAGLPTTAFPAHALALRDTLRDLVRLARSRYPNLRVLYVSSRIYGGYGGSATSPTGEPISYENGFGAKWLIEAQIDGDPLLGYGSGAAPLLLWGPYLWADGATPNGAGTAWLPADFEADTVHPSAAGEAKVGALLTAFFANEPSATWLRARDETRLAVHAPVADAWVDAAAPAANFGADTQLRLAGGASPRRAWLKFASSGDVATLLHAKLVVRDVDTGTSPTLSLASDTLWDEATITASNQPPIDGGTLSSGSGWTRENCPSFGVTNALRNDADGTLSFVVSTSVVGAQALYSREGAFGPLLVLSVRSPLLSDGFEDP
jgi:hypothetical protein